MSRFYDLPGDLQAIIFRKSMKYAADMAAAVGRERNSRRLPVYEAEIEQRIKTGIAMLVDVEGLQFDPDSLTGRMIMRDASAACDLLRDIDDTKRAMGRPLGRGRSYLFHDRSMLRIRLVRHAEFVEAAWAEQALAQMA